MQEPLTRQYPPPSLVRLFRIHTAPAVIDVDQPQTVLFLRHFQTFEDAVMVAFDGARSPAFRLADALTDRHLERADAAYSTSDDSSQDT
jgi:hypothetical protein